MEIKILHDDEWKSSKYFGEKYIIEKENAESVFDNIPCKKVYIKNTDSFELSKEEVLPNIEKYDVGGIKQTSFNPAYLYFTNIEKNGEDSCIVNIIRYSLKDNSMESIYGFDSEISKINNDYRYKIFILNDTILFIQKEEKIKLESSDYEDFLKFSQKIVYLKDMSVFNVSDEIFLNNGISDIIAVSESKCIIKLGFSLLENNRFTLMTKEESSLETLAMMNISQLISDIVIGHSEISLEVIEQAYYTNTIPYIKKTGDYLIYSCVNNETKVEEINFYNIETLEKKSCINKDVVINSDLGNACIIADEPYVCISKDSKYSFLNINTNKIENVFDNKLRLSHVFSDSLLFSGEKKKFISRKVKPYYELINFKTKENLYNENKEYIDSFESDDKCIYIITG